MYDTPLHNFYSSATAMLFYEIKIFDNVANYKNYGATLTNKICHILDLKKQKD